MIEGQGSGAVGTAELPVGVRLRHAWRPPMLRTLDALLLGIEARARPSYPRTGNASDTDVGDD